MKGIVINRMYAGSYLANNLGHEVINMFQADNGKHYLYLNPTGQLSNNAKKCDNMLLVRYVGNRTVEILAKAQNLKPVPGADLYVPNIYEQNKALFCSQCKYITKEGITYAGVSLLDIFKDAEQQNIFVSYEVSDKDFFVPADRRIFIRFKDAKTVSSEGEDNVVQAQVPDGLTIEFTDYNFNPHLKPQYIFPSSSGDKRSDYEALEKIINDTSLWKLSNEKVKIYGDMPCCKDSLFDICSIQYDENCFSNALSYFMRKYRSLWRKFFKCAIGVDLGQDFTVVREADATIIGNKNTGGRIDILLRGGNAMVIIENKIKSDINKLDGDADLNQTQLDRYWNYGKDIVSRNSGIVLKAILLVPDYNVPKIPHPNFLIIKYSQVCDFLRNRKEVFRDPDFHALYCAMLRHSHEYVSDMLYADMKCKFFKRIKDLIRENSKSSK